MFARRTFSVSYGAFLRIDKRSENAVRHCHLYTRTRWNSKLYLTKKLTVPVSLPCLISDSAEAVPECSDRESKTTNVRKNIDTEFGNYHAHIRKKIFRDRCPVDLWSPQSRDCFFLFVILHWSNQRNSVPVDK